MLKLNSTTLATWCKELTHWKRRWCWERLKAGGEGDNRGCDGWMASPTRWTWVWVISRSWWWTGKPGMLQSMGLQRVRLDTAEQLNWTELMQNSARHYRRLATFSSVQFSSVAQSCPTLCDPMIIARQASLSVTNSQSSLRLTSSSQWCHSAISTSVVPFSSCP